MEAEIQLYFAKYMPKLSAEIMKKKIKDLKKKK